MILIWSVQATKRHGWRGRQEDMIVRKMNEMLSHVDENGKTAHATPNVFLELTSSNVLGWLQQVQTLNSGTVDSKA